MAASVDFDVAYAIPADLQIVQRDANTVQIGTEPPRRVLLIDAPAHACDVLTRLNGAISAGEAVARSDGDPLIWRSLLGGLLAAGLLAPAPRGSAAPPHLVGERLSLTHQHGAAAAGRLLRARSDALVVLDGTGPVAQATCALLAAAGVGHVHHRSAGAPGGVRSAAWLAAPDVRVHRPAPQIPPSVVVLAGPAPPDLTRAAELVTAMVPHLAVQVTQARLIVGPLVLPGRSACLNCIDRRRADADPGWPAIAAAMRERPVIPAALAAHAAAEIAAGQVLELLDGLRRPETVDATLERRAGAVRVERRHWPAHPDCGCRLLSGQL